MFPPSSIDLRVLHAVYHETIQDVRTLVGGNGCQNLFLLCSSWDLYTNVRQIYKCTQRMKGISRLIPEVRIGPSWLTGPSWLRIFCDSLCTLRIVLHVYVCWPQQPSLLQWDIILTTEVMVAKKNLHILVGEPWVSD